MKKKGYTMTLDRIDVSPNTNDDENWHCPDCQSWGPFTMTMITRARLRDEGTTFVDDEGDAAAVDTVFARCPDCQRQAPVASFRHEGA